MKIKSLEIENYRAFYGKHHIPLDCRNVLIYGENGSGKSSLYQAFYDFFCSTNKSSRITFEKNKWNIKKDESVTSGLKFVFEDDNEYVFSPSKAVTKDKTDFIDIGKQKPFYTYRRLLQTYIVDKGQVEKTIFHLLINDILSTYVTTYGDTLLDTWNSFKSLIAASGGIKPKYLDIQNKIELFSDEFSAVTKSLFDKVNKYLKTYFDNGIELDIQMPKFQSKATKIGDLRTEVREQVLSAKISITLKLFGESIPDYHFFLNEARLSALSISLYLASLQVIPKPENLKLLFLDDIFIGLDTSNRIPLLKIIESSDFKDWQILITSYDRNWYELARNYLSEWKCIEMFVGRDKSDTFDIPAILHENLTPIDKAKEYFNAHDYYSSGNNIRKAIEAKIQKILPDTYLIGIKDLEGLIMKLFKYYNDCNSIELISNDLERELLTFKDIVLNPSSHYDIKSPIFKIEVEKAFKVYDLLNEIPQIKRTVLCNIGEQFRFKIENYEAHFILMENVYKIEVNGSNYQLSDPNHKLINYTYKGTKFYKKGGGAYSQSEILKQKSIKFSERTGRIKHFLNLDSDLDWRTDFINNDEKSLNELLSS